MQTTVSEIMFISACGEVKQTAHVDSMSIMVTLI